MIDGWAKIAGRLGYYNYMYNLADATLPFFKFTPCKKEFPYLADKGLPCMTMEVLSNWHIYGPHIYLGLRLAYDPARRRRRDHGGLLAEVLRPAGRAVHEGLLDGHRRGDQPADEPRRQFLRPAGDLHAGVPAAVPGAARPGGAGGQGRSVYAERVALHAEGLQSAVEYRADLRRDGPRRVRPGAGRSTTRWSSGSKAWRPRGMPTVSTGRPICAACC